jgi:antitoxin component HigA of HigAB toxin-antitoxin module
VTSKKRIKNDEQYEKALKGLVDIATALEEDPSLRGEERDKQMRIYELTCEAVDVYKAEQYAAAFPHMESMYKELGLL